MASHICQTADTDILVIEDMALLKQAMGGKATIKEALPSVKTVVMIEASEEDMGIKFRLFFCALHHDLLASEMPEN